MDSASFALAGRREDRRLTALDCDIGRLCLRYTKVALGSMLWTSSGSRVLPTVVYHPDKVRETNIHAEAIKETLKVRTLTE